MLSEAALPPCPLKGRTYTARAAICGHYFRLIIAFISTYLELSILFFFSLPPGFSKLLRHTPTVLGRSSHIE